MSGGVGLVRERRWPAWFCWPRSPAPAGRANRNRRRGRRYRCLRMHRCPTSHVPGAGGSSAVDGDGSEAEWFPRFAMGDIRRSDRSAERKREFQRHIAGHAPDTEPRRWVGCVVGRNRRDPSRAAMDLRGPPVDDHIFCGADRRLRPGGASPRRRGGHRRHSSCGCCGRRGCDAGGTSRTSEAGPKRCEEGRRVGASGGGAPLRRQGCGEPSSAPTPVKAGRRLSASTCS